MYIKYEDIDKTKEWKKIHNTNANYKKSGVAKLISDKEY